jgi:hypothetical protein
MAKPISEVWIVMTHRVVNPKLAIETSVCNVPAFLSEAEAQKYADRLNEGYNAKEKYFDAKKVMRGSKYADVGSLWVSGKVEPPAAAQGDC